MIKKLRIHGFKRFEDQTFDIPGHVVLAGPNNTGKTTVLQAIAAWDLAFRRWKELNDYQRHGGGYTKAPIARQAFAAVPLRRFDLLWNDRQAVRPIEIEIAHESGWSCTMEFIPDSTEQVNVRPKPDLEPEVARTLQLQTVFVPPMTGLNTEEPVYQQPYIQRLVGQGKPGDVIRNLLVRASKGAAWEQLKASVHRLFGYTILPPDDSGAVIIAEFQAKTNGPRLDIGSAGSGLQQVLMLLAFLYTYPASVLLVDEPDAHLHIILQDAIFGELHSAALASNSQLIISTHSEVIINAVDYSQLCMLFDRPRPVATREEQALLAKALGRLSHADVMAALNVRGVLYVEDYTDRELLLAWAKVLNHPAHGTLTSKTIWKPVVWQPRKDARGVKAREHYEALCLVRPDLPALEILDGDSQQDFEEEPLTGKGFQRVKWRRYEIESYLFHPEALVRFVAKYAGGTAKTQIEAMQAYLHDNMLPAILKDPLGDHDYLNVTKARTRLIPPILQAAGINLDYTQYSRIALEMQPAEIHAEVTEKLDAIQKAFGL